MNFPDELLDHLRARLTSLQEQFNFDPQAGARQIQGRPKLAQPYGAFQELLELIRKLDLPIEIPFDSVGLDLQARCSAKDNRIDYVYFVLEEGTSIWKIGHSVSSYRRLSNLRTANSTPLTIQYEFKGGVELETALKRYFRHYKTRDKNKWRGEWFDIPRCTLNETVRRLKSEQAVGKVIPDFLDEPLANPNPNQRPHEVQENREIQEV